MNDPSMQLMGRPFPIWPTPFPAMEEAIGFARKPARPSWKRKGPAAGGGRGRRWKKASAPRNTTSYLIRAKRAGGIASLVSPCPVTPAILPTPRLSPSREVLVEMAREAWGVDGYGSMKGLIRLRSPRAAGGAGDENDDGGEDESDVEEHVEVERRLDQDLSRFEMVLPGGGGGTGDGETEEAHVARAEEENLTLKERLFLMEREMGELRRRLLALEARCPARGGNWNTEEEVVSENNGGGGGEDAEMVTME